MIIKYLTIAIIFITNIYTVLSQVTIGNTEKPADGALLQLKNKTEDPTTGSNANKGLMLPRVQLISPSELYPMFDKDDTNYTTEQKSNHTGLIVYVPELWNDNYCPGIYTWNGENWNALIQKKELDQSTFTDGEGNIYTYANFGGTYWMTQNVRSITEYGSGDYSRLLADITEEGTLTGLGINTGESNNPLFITDKSDIIGKQNDYYMNGSLIEATLEEFVEKMGLIYRYPQALKACPTGWRLPNQDEFIEMYEYIKNATGTTISTAGESMKNDQSSYAYKNNPTSNISWDGVNVCDQNSINIGFKAMPTGAINFKTNTNQGTYGSSAFWWYNQGTDFATLNTPYMQRYAIKWNSTELSTIDPATGVVARVYLNSGNSVRCIK